MKHNKAKMLVGMLIMLAGFGMLALDIGVMSSLVCLPLSCFGYGLMAMAMDASGGTLHQSLGSYASKNSYLLIGLLFGSLIGLITNADLTVLGLTLRLLSLSLAALAWAAPYYATRYPAGSPLLKFVAEDRR